VREWGAAFWVKYLNQSGKEEKERKTSGKDPGFCQKRGSREVSDEGHKKRKGGEGWGLKSFPQGTASMERKGRPRAIHLERKKKIGQITGSRAWGQKDDKSGEDRSKRVEF